LTFVRDVAAFLRRHQVEIYSEHLSYCGDHGHLYDLLPIPFTDEAVHYVAERIRQVQDVLGHKLVIENVSYYAAPAQQLAELDFLNAVLAEADCELLLDVNNVYVNSVNHGFDPVEFLRGLPAPRVRYFHVAGHYDEAPDLLIDTHGSAVKHDVWRLLETAYELFGAQPTLLERDFNIPPLPVLQAELQQILTLQDAPRLRGNLSLQETHDERRTRQTDTA